MADLGRQLADLLYGESQQPKETTGQKIARRLTGAGETAATIGTGLLGSVPAGLAGLTQLIPTRGRAPDVNRAAQKVEDVQSSLTYLPRTETGQRYLQNTAGALETLGAPAEYLGEKALQYTGSPGVATAANVLLDPVNYIGMPGSGRAIAAGAKAAGRGVMQAGRAMAQDPAVGAAVERAIQRVAPAAMPMYAVKPKGGNWIAGEVEGVTEPLRQKTPGGYMDAGEALAEMRRVYPPETTNPDLLRRQEPMMRTLEASAALNNWIDKKLNRYIRNEMGTPEDPVRKLAEQGILHYEPRTGNILEDDARIRRLGEGEQLGVSPLARAWEDNADLSVIPSVAQDFQSGGYGNLKIENPWIEKVPPESKIYSTSSFARQDLGLDHLIDELKNSIRPDSDLPAHLRWKPEDLEKVTMEQAVRRVHDINEYRAQKKAEANEVLARNPATFTFKEYPTIPGTDQPNARGLAWKEIREPEAAADKAASRQQLQEALKYEGEVMGHCVGGYCEDVLRGDTKIFSLRDKKGEPHVTIEVAPPPRYSDADVMEMYPDVIESMRRRGDEDAISEFIGQTLAELNNKPSQIIQIKGKANRAPKEEYLPFVQDFVRGGNWARIGDIQNTGLKRKGDFIDEFTSDQLDSIGKGEYVTQAEIESLRKALKGKKTGGSVHISNNPDTMALELATGGAVKAAKAAAKAAEKETKKKLSVPYDIPRAPAKSKEEIQAIAERMARQMTDEFVRPDPKKSKNVAGKTFEQFKREKELEKEYVTRRTKDVTPPEIADIEKQKGMVKFAIPGDTTIADQELLQAGPYRLESPAPQHGGPMFPLGGEGAWASNNPIAKNVQTRVREMSEFFDAPVLGQYMSMGPSGSMFAQHLADANLQAIDLSRMTKSQIEEFNKMLREGNEKTGPRESFPGIEDKGDAYLYLAFDPKLRIYFNQLMQMPSITSRLNLPDGRVILDAITEPELRNKEIMTSGLSQFEFDPSVKSKDIPLSMHPTYSHLIPMREGAPVTRTRYPTPAELEFPDVTKFIREKYRPSEFTPTFQKASPRQKIDQQAIDEIKMYEEMMKSLTGKKKGGAVKKQAGGAIKAAAKAASKAVKPSELTPEARAAAAEVRANAERIGKARAELEKEQAGKEYFQRPEGYGSTEKVQERAKKIKERETYPQAEALERARLNAVKMLGLPEDNTAMDRARALGFMDDTFHGTFGRFEDFDLSKANPRSQYMPGLFTADDPRLAENFGDFIMPLMQRKGVTVLEKRAAREAGLPVPEVNTIHDKSKGIRVTNDLSNVRSRFAAFDPAESDKPGLLKKKGGKVKFTDNLDAMRLAVQKRK